MTDTVVSSGVTSASLYIDHLDTLEIKSGGRVVDTTVRGVETISAGGSATGDVIDFDIIGANSGVQFVYGTAAEATVHSSAYQVISRGGEAVDTHVDAGGAEVVDSGGIADGGVVYSRAGIFVAHGGVASALTLSSGHLILSDDAVAFEPGSDGGGRASATVVDGGGVTVFSGGVASNTVVRDSGLVVISSGGIGRDTFLRSDGFLQDWGGLVSSTRVSGGATEIILAGESIGAYVYSGGVEATNGTGVTTDLTMSSGAELDWFSTSAVLDSMVLRPGAELFVEYTSASVTISNGTLEVFESGGGEVLSATLKDGGTGLGFIVDPISAGSTEFIVTHASPDAGVLAQTLAAFTGGAPGFTGSAMPSGGGLVTPIVQFLDTRQ